MLWGLFVDSTLLNNSGFGQILVFQTTNIFTRFGGNMLGNLEGKKSFML